MKAFVAVLIFSAPFLSQSQPAPALSGCGQPRQNLGVYLDPSQHSIGQPLPGKALIYFIQDTDQPAVFAYPIVKVAIDGKLVGANSANSYFAVAVEPGWHDLCTEAQSPFPASDPEFDHLVAEPGKVYSFRVRLFLADSAVEYSSLVPLDGDEAANLIASYPQATVYYPNEIVPVAIQRTLAAGQVQSPPVSPIALNIDQTKAALSGPGDHSPSKNSSKGDHRDSGKPPKEHHDKSAGSAEGSTPQRTH
jgi:hypothetical protein